MSRLYTLYPSPSVSYHTRKCQPLFINHCVVARQLGYLSIYAHSARSNRRSPPPLQYSGVYSRVTPSSVIVKHLKTMPRDLSNEPVGYLPVWHSKHNTCTYRSGLVGGARSSAVSAIYGICYHGYLPLPPLPAPPPPHCSPVVFILRWCRLHFVRTRSRLPFAPAAAAVSDKIPIYITYHTTAVTLHHPISP